MMLVAVLEDIRKDVFTDAEKRRVFESRATNYYGYAPLIFEYEEAGSGKYHVNIRIFLTDEHPNTTKFIMRLKSETVKDEMFLSGMAVGIASGINAGREEFKSGIREAVNNAVDGYLTTV